MEMAVLSLESVPPRPMVAGRWKADARTPSLARRGFQWMWLFALSMAAYLLISRFVLLPIQVQGQSMMPTLRNSDSYFLNRWLYCLRPPHRGDVVVLKDPSDGSYAVKRIIALAGDAIYLKSGRVYINGRMLEEPYLNPGTPTYPSDAVKEELIVCGSDRYFVMGDNRNNSFDSRMYGPVRRHDILGLIKL